MASLSTVARYFPPEDRHGLPGFPRVLKAVAEAYRAKRSQVAGVAQDLVSRLKQGQTLRSEPQLLTADILTGAYQALVRTFDDDNGGFGPGPEVPASPRSRVSTAVP